MRTGHGSAAKILILTGRIGAGDIHSRRTYIHPISIIGEIGLGTVLIDGAYRDAAVIITRRAVRDIFIAGGKDNYSALHRGTRQLVSVVVATGVLVKVVHGLGKRALRILMIISGVVHLIALYPAVVVKVKIVTPTVLGDMGAFVCSLLDGGCKTGSSHILSVVTGLEHLKGQKGDSSFLCGSVTAGNSGHTCAIVVYGSDGTGNVSAVGMLDNS